MGKSYVYSFEWWKLDTKEYIYCVYTYMKFKTTENLEDFQDRTRLRKLF